MHAIHVGAGSELLLTQSLSGNGLGAEFQN